LTWSSDSAVEAFTKTEAVGSCFSSVNTDCCGIASCTEAAETPSIASIVLASSPSIARL
jgi:hypothetical protein